MSLKMRGEVLDEVVRRLRSGKYKQGRSALRMKHEGGRPDTFCCLGIVCEIAVEEGIVTRSHAGEERASYDYTSPDGHSESAYLPPAVIDWAGIVSDFEKLADYDDYYHESRGSYGEHTYDALSVMNDSHWDFEQIADWMEANVVCV